MPRKGENIYKRKNGRWKGRYIKARIDGRTKYGYVYAHSYKEVKERLALAKEQVNTKHCNVSLESQAKTCLFSIISKEWVDINKPRWKASTGIKYTNIINNHLLPEFGQRNITEISREDVLAFISKLLTHGGNHGQGLAPKTIIMK